MADEVQSTDAEERADELATAMSELATVLIEELDVAATLRKVAELATLAIPDCDSAGVTIIEHGRPMTAVCVDERTLSVDQAQYDVDEGPCLEAYRTGTVQRVEVEEAMERWPEFAKAAGTLGIRSYLAAPLTVRDENIGALNLYGSRSHGFDALDESLIALFASQASIAVANARVYRSATAVAEQLGTALVSRAVIEQAKGVLMARHGIDADTAFSLLRARSQRDNRKLRDIAEEIVASTAAANG